MVAASQLTPGMTIEFGKQVYRVEQATRFSGAARAAHPIMKVKLFCLNSGKLIEKNFKPVQEVEEVVLEEHQLEFLYLEDGLCIFLDTKTLELIHVPRPILGHKVEYLKEGVAVRALCHKNAAFSIELPQFLELRVSSIESGEGSDRVAVLETGARVEIPPFIDVDDIIKIDPNEGYIQRV